MMFFIIMVAYVSFTMGSIYLCYQIYTYANQFIIRANQQPNELSPYAMAYFCRTRIDRVRLIIYRLLSLGLIEKVNPENHKHTFRQTDITRYKEFPLTPVERQFLTYFEQERTFQGQSGFSGLIKINAQYNREYQAEGRKLNRLNNDSFMLQISVSSLLILLLMTAIYLLMAVFPTTLLNSNEVLGIFETKEAQAMLVPWVLAAIIFIAYFGIIWPLQGKLLSNAALNAINTLGLRLPHLYQHDPNSTSLMLLLAINGLNNIPVKTQHNYLPFFIEDSRDGCGLLAGIHADLAGIDRTTMNKNRKRKNNKNGHSSDSGGGGCGNNQDDTGVSSDGDSGCGGGCGGD